LSRISLHFKHIFVHVQVTALQEEVKRHKEMCANYEQQLQRTQQQMAQEMAEKDEAMETMMDTVDKHKVSGQIIIIRVVGQKKIILDCKFDGEKKERSIKKVVAETTR